MTFKLRAVDFPQPIISFQIIQQLRNPEELLLRQDHFPPPAQFGVAFCAVCGFSVTPAFPPSISPVLIRITCRAVSL